MRAGARHYTLPTPHPTGLEDVLYVNERLGVPCFSGREQMLKQGLVVLLAVQLAELLEALAPGRHWYWH